MSRHRRSRLLVAIAAVVLSVTLGCASSSPEGRDLGNEAVATPTMVESAERDDAVEVLPTAAAAPTQQPATDSASAVEPSQTLVEATRDGVSPAVANLPFDKRVHVEAEVEVAGQRWVISRLSNQALDLLAQSDSAASIRDLFDGEVLQLDGNRIVRAVRMSGAPPSWIIGHGETVIVGRVADGGYPDNAIVLIDVPSGDITKMFAPSGYERVWLETVAQEWLVADPASALELSALSAKVWQSADDPDTHQASVAQVVGAVESAATTDVTTLPFFALDHDRCTPHEWVGDVLFELDGICVNRQGDMLSGGMPDATSIGGESVPGSVVGLGRLRVDGPLLAAIVSPRAPGVSAAPLLFVDVSDPSSVIDTGLDGWNEGSVVDQVSFFDGGFVETRGVDLSVRVTAYDAASDPIEDFLSPTDRELGYPPDPYVGSVDVSPDGRLMAWVERANPPNASGLPGLHAELVVADRESGVEQQRIDFEIDEDLHLRWMDYDGRWAVLSFLRLGGFDSGPGFPLMIDTELGTIYPLGINHPLVVTFELGD